MQRRHFLFLTAAAFGVTPSAFGHRTHGAPLGLAQPDLLALLGDADCVYRIGCAYRATVPHEAAAAHLTALLRPAAPAFEAQIRADFAEGRTVCLDGWILSITEARQCALFAYQQEGCHAY